MQLPVLVVLCYVLVAHASAYVPQPLDRSLQDLHRRAPADSQAQTQTHASTTTSLALSRSFTPTSSITIPTTSSGSRGNGNGNNSSTGADATTTITTSLQSSIIQASTESNLPTALPQPFDTSLGSNFTNAGCPAYFATFLKDPTFINCYPLSLLLQNSNGFFQSSKSVVLVTRVLDAACKADFNVCVQKMNDIQSGLRSKDNCGADYDLENPLVRQAYAGLISYTTLYNAGCQRSQTGSYCYADAVTNSSSPTDGFVYYLPLGVQLPATNLKPSCNACLRRTMNIFQAAAANKTQSLNTDYVPAAQYIDSICGSTFVNSTIPSAANMARGSIVTALLSSIGLLATIVFLL